MFADADLIRAVLIKVRDLPPQGSDRELSVEGYPKTTPTTKVCPLGAQLFDCLLGSRN